MEESDFPINFRLIKDYYREQFLKYFNKFDNGFMLLIDSEIYKLFSYILFPLDNDLKTKIKKHLVLDENITDILTDMLDPKQTKADPTRRNIFDSIETVIYILKPRKSVVQKAYMASKVLESIGIIDYNYMFIPRGMTYLSESYLINNPEKVEFINMNIIPFEKDVLSLEITDSFFNCIQQEDLEYLSQSSEAISRLEKVYGTIKYKFAIGPNAVDVLNRLLSVSTELDTPFQISDSSDYQGYSNTVKSGEIDAIFIIDRKADLVTPFCIQQTYEGMLDEHYGINATTLDVNTSIVKGDAEEEKKAIAANLPPPKESMSIRTDQDLIIEELRDLHFVALESKFSQRVNDIDTIIKQKDNPKNVDDLQKYIEKLKNMKITQVKDKITYHINLAHYINSKINNFDYNDCLSLEQSIIYGENSKEMIESFQLLMAKGVDKDSVLRLLALTSITQSGLKEKVYQELLKEYTDWYGYEEMNTLLNMEEMGLFMKKQSRYKYDWQRIVTNFKLINEEVQLKNPIDYSYVYNGYSPLSVKLVDFIMNEKGMSQMESSLRYVTSKYKFPQNEQEFFEKRASYTTGKKIVMVFYVGGCTYAEISAIRFLNKLHTDKLFVVATTQILNYKKCINQLRSNI